METKGFRISLGDTLAERNGEQYGEDYGVFRAESAEAALVSALRGIDSTRRYHRPALLSTKQDFGRGTPGRINGHGAQDRSGWWYVSNSDGELVGIYTVAEDC